MKPADIRLLHPEQFEFSWRTLLRREHGGSYPHVDGHGIDCLTDDTAYQIYHHHASWGDRTPERLLVVGLIVAGLIGGPTGAIGLRAYSPKERVGPPESRWVQPSVSQPFRQSWRPSRRQPSARPRTR